MTRPRRVDPDDLPMNPVAEYGQMPTIAAFLEQHSRGEAAAQITALFADMLNAVRATGKAGSLTIRIKAEPMNEAVVSFGIDAAAKVPRPASLDLLYVDEHGLPARNDPRQMRLPMADLTDKPDTLTMDLTGDTK